MKKLIFLFILIFGFSFFNAQNIETELKKNKFFTGQIDNSANLKVVFDSISLENRNPEIYKVKGYSDVEGTKANFEGTITLNLKKTKKAKNKSDKIYDLKLLENGTGKHNGIFSGQLICKEAMHLNLLKFEGTWINYGNTLQFPFYFNNQIVYIK